MVAPEDWHSVLDRLDNAGSEQDAQQATVELIDVVIEGGVAVSANAEAVSEAILLHQGLRGDFRVYLLWILFEISLCLGIWESAYRRGNIPNNHAGVELERRSSSRLAAGGTRRGQHVTWAFGVADYEVNLDFRLLDRRSRGSCGGKPGHWVPRLRQPDV